MNPPGWVKAIEANLPAHYIDCDRFQTYNYGTKSGKCDCTADEDIRHLIAWATSIETSTAAPVAVDERVPAGRSAAALAGTRDPRIHIGGDR